MKEILHPLLCKFPAGRAGIRSNPAQVPVDTPVHLRRSFPGKGEGKYPVHGVFFSVTSRAKRPASTVVFPDPAPAATTVLLSQFIAAACSLLGVFASSIMCHPIYRIDGPANSVVIAGKTRFIIIADGSECT